MVLIGKGWYFAELRGSSCNLTAASAHLIQIRSIPFALVTGPPVVQLSKTIFLKSASFLKSCNQQAPGGTGGFLVFESMWWRRQSP